MACNNMLPGLGVDCVCGISLPPSSTLLPMAENGHGGHAEDSDFTSIASLDESRGRFRDDRLIETDKGTT